MNAFGAADSLDQLLVATIRQDEICIKEEDIGIRHSGTEILKAPEQRIRNSYAILPRVRNEIVQWDQFNPANLLQFFYCWVHPNVIEQLLFRYNDRGALKNGGQCRKISRRQCCREGKIQKIIDILAAPRIRHQAHILSSHLVSTLDGEVLHYA